jgi:ATP-dependent Clp protease adaptor protein ClpS
MIQENQMPARCDLERLSAVCSKNGREPSRLSGEEREGGGVAVETEKPRLAEPGKWAVYIHNDDYSTFDFVVEVLQRFFKKTSQEAAEITVRVHHEGKGLAGVFSHEIAETKVAQVEELARERGYPLRATAEPLP